MNWYCVYQGYGQAYLGNGGLILGSSRISANDPAASNYDTPFQLDQKWPKNYHLATFPRVQSKSLIPFVQHHCLIWVISRNLLGSSPKETVNPKPWRERLKMSNVFEFCLSIKLSIIFALVSIFRMYFLRSEKKLIGFDQF